MSRRFAIEGLNIFGALERKLSLSGLSSGSTLAVTLFEHEIPPPDPEPDPGPFPGEDPPIVYPPLPPSGPVGPG